ncbi:MAG: NADH-quinone oxidoreductase subunit A [Candidatus Bathyarchaeia archaeon]
MEVVVALVLSLAAALTIYWLGGAITPKSKPTVNKLMAYACGEKFKGMKFQVNAEEFYLYAIYFLVFDVLAFVLSTSMGSTGLMPVIYLLVVIAALIPLLGRRE